MSERIPLSIDCNTCQGQGKVLYHSNAEYETNPEWVTGVCDECRGSGIKRLVAEHLEALLLQAWGQIDAKAKAMFVAESWIQSLENQLDLLQEKLTAVNAQVATYQKWVDIKDNAGDPEKERAEKHAFAQASELAAKHPKDAITHRVDPIVADAATLIKSGRVDPSIAPRITPYYTEHRGVTQQRVDEALAPFEHDVTFVQLWLKSRSER